MMIGQLSAARGDVAAARQDFARAAIHFEASIGSDNSKPAIAPYQSAGRAIVPGRGSTIAAAFAHSLIGSLGSASLCLSRMHGVTYGTPTWIWSVVVDHGLYVRGYNGQNSRWYQAAVRQKGGAYHRRRHDERNLIRISERIGKRSHRRRLSREVPRQSIPKPDDWRSRRHRQGYAGRHQCLIIDQS